ncbi:hypothetical protein FHG87_008807 [Trinorchestia longiramus]|nr:hypothetical protein FHG87_008807 [Trinorchestia longiramus]
MVARINRGVRTNRELLQLLDVTHVICLTALLCAKLVTEWCVVRHVSQCHPDYCERFIYLNSSLKIE